MHGTALYMYYTRNLCVTLRVRKIQAASVKGNAFTFLSTTVQISAGLTNISRMAVVAFHLINCSLTVARFVLSLMFVSSCRKVVIGLCATRNQLMLSQTVLLRTTLSRTIILYRLMICLLGSNHLQSSE